MKGTNYVEEMKEEEKSEKIEEIRGVYD